MYFKRRRACRFCVDTDLKVDYKNPKLLQGYTTERSKILPGRTTGTCTAHQRKLTEAIKRARHLALLSYSLPLYPAERYERY